MKIYFSIYDYDFLKTGGYGWTEVQEKVLINKSFDDLILDLIEEFDADCGWGGIWQYARNDAEGRITGFVLHHADSSKEYVYDIVY